MLTKPWGADLVAKLREADALYDLARKTDLPAEWSAYRQVREAIDREVGAWPPLDRPRDGEGMMDRRVA